MTFEVILAGRPNSGKSTLFNRLAGQSQKVGNYAGVTVEKKTAELKFSNDEVVLVTDLPGIYSLQANTVDEEVALKHLHAVRNEGHIVFVVDGNNLEQELILPLILKKKGFNLSIAVNMMDEVAANKKILNLVGMQDVAGIPFFPLSARSGDGVGALKQYLESMQRKISGASSLDDLQDQNVEQLYKGAREESRALNQLNPASERDFLFSRDKAIDRFLLHPILGPFCFLLTMFVVFQSVFTWAVPLSDLIEAGFTSLGAGLKNIVPNEMLASLLADGVLAGVGAVLVFVPPIALLFLLIGLLEYTGYLPRIAFLVDRLLKPYGLDGKVFIPLLSSVACAVPGIMATRTIENQRTRLITIMISPLMTCSARLPVYTLLISTFIPQASIGMFPLQGLVMFGMYMLAVITALVVALVLDRIGFARTRPTVDIIHLPHYRVPDWRSLFTYLSVRIMAFLKKAGTIIATMAILLWVLLTFPKSDALELEYKAKIAAAGETTEQAVALEREYSSLALERSVGGQMGHMLEPIFRPIGYDWKLTIGIIASLSAREVFVSTLGTIFALEASDDDTAGLAAALMEAKNEDGTAKYTLATCLSLLVFFAFSLQCISTIGVAKRETNSWKIPAIMFFYMFALAYGAAFVAYRLGLLLA